MDDCSYLNPVMLTPVVDECKKAGLNADSGIIRPFHSLKSQGNRCPRPLPQPHTRYSHVSAKNRYNRVRRRSPLCHDVIEFMLDGTSVSSQESLPLAGSAETIGKTPELDIDTHGSANVSAGLPTSRIITSKHPLSEETASFNSMAKDTHSYTSVHDAVIDISERNSCENVADNNAFSDDDDDDDDDSSYGSWSDSGPGNDSDEGFDGRCHTPPSSAGASPQSTAGCSRSSSRKSNRSGELSDSSTAADPSPKWWKRHFQTSKNKSPDSPYHRSDEPNSRLSSDSSRSSSPKSSNSSLIPILTKIKRSVSSRSAKKPEFAHAEKGSRLSALATHTSPMTRTKSLANPPSSTSDHPTPGKIHKAVAKPNSSVSRIIPESGDDYISKAQWVLFKCKGMLNLNVVTVPPSVSSLNHKDTFLLYPRALRNAGDDGLASNAESPSKGKLRLSQDYDRRKSICSLASRIIYVWIGAHSSAIKRDAIMRVSREIRDKELEGMASIVVVDESSASDIARRKFFSQLYAVEYGTTVSVPRDISTVYSRISPLSSAGDDISFERALERRKVMYGFWDTIPPATIVSVGTDINASLLLKVPLGGAVVLDTWTDVFVWWRNEPSNPAVRQCALNFAQMLVRDVYIPQRPKSASVWNEVRGFEHVIFKTKFPDWPYVFTSSIGSTRVVCHKVPAANTITPPVAVPVRSVSRASTQAVAVA